MTKKRKNTLRRYLAKVEREYDVVLTEQNKEVVEKLEKEVEEKERKLLALAGETSLSP